MTDHPVTQNVVRAFDTAEQNTNQNPRPDCFIQNDSVCFVDDKGCWLESSVVFDAGEMQ